jgi:GAF domain-containing protein
MLCVPLWAGDEHLGTLSLYGDKPDCFDATAKQLADLYATHAALALAEARRTDQLKRAILSRDLIGQAKGILMERERLTADQAFDRLREVSQRLNRKITDVAQELTSRGELPSS